jgi:Flp pilus assembly protein TadG
VAVEFAIVLPLLALLAFGAVEMGSAWNDSQTVLASTRTAARSLAQFGDAPQADRDALLSVDAAYATSGLTVRAVVIYESDDTVNDGGPPDLCLTAAENGVVYSGPAACNVYPAAEYGIAILPGGTANFGCSGAAFDVNWCPSTRTRAQATATFVGVYVIAGRTSVTGSDFVPVPTQLDQFSVMRMEPMPS